MATSALLLGGAYVAGTVVNQMNNQKKEEVLQKLQRQKIKLLEEKTRWLEIKNREQTRYRESQKEINDLKLKIKEEEKAISQYDKAANDNNTKFMVILGNTGDGKSTLCNRLNDDKSEYGDKGPFLVSDDAKSQTKKVKHIEYHKYNTKYIIVDTPGINDSEQNDDSHINDLVNYLYGCGGVNAFILVRNGTNIRFDANFQKMLNQYQDYFGQKFWNHLIIVLTRIEGKERKRFYEKRKDKELQNILYKHYDLKQKGMRQAKDIPIYTIGSDSYNECVNMIRNEVCKREKFECSDLKSPIDEFREELEMLMESFNDFGVNLIDDAQENINRIDREMDKVGEKIENPSQIPLLKSAVKSVGNHTLDGIKYGIKYGMDNYYYDHDKENENGGNND